jgi:plastocyanin
MITVPALALALTLTAACGGDKQDPTAKSAAADTALVVRMLDNTFEPKDLTARAGQTLTVTVENKGTAMHNWRVASAKGADGRAIQTELLPGGKSQSVTFTLSQAGTYELICDIHPAEMRGRLTVQ